MRRLVVALLGLTLAGTWGCDGQRDRAPDDAAIRAAVEQALREQREADRQIVERAAQAEQERRDAEQGAIDVRTGQEDARKATQTHLEERLRSVLVDPSSMQLRNQRLNGAGNALCAEVSGKNKQGVVVGFRRVVVTETIVSFDRDPDDSYREPQRRYPAIASVSGCN